MESNAVFHPPVVKAVTVGSKTCNALMFWKRKNMAAGLAR